MTGFLLKGEKLKQQLKSSCVTMKKTTAESFSAAVWMIQGMQ